MQIEYVVVSDVFRTGHSRFTLILGMGLRTHGADGELESLTFLLLSELVMQIEYSLVLHSCVRMSLGLAVAAAL